VEESAVKENICGNLPEKELVSNFEWNEAELGRKGRSASYFIEFLKQKNGAADNDQCLNNGADSAGTD
jgi:hypothetical protein